MVTICAWCQRYLGTKEPLADPSLTHGICKTCAMRQQLGGFLDELAFDDAVELALRG